MKTTDGREIELHRPSDLPDQNEIEEILEPRILAQIHMPTPYLGPVLALCEERRGIQRDLIVHSDRRAVLRYDLPLAEVAVDFYDKLKSVSRGYASMNYDLIGFAPEALVKVDVLVNGDPVDALSRDRAPRLRLPPRSRADREDEEPHPAAACTRSRCRRRSARRSSRA